MSDTPGWGKEPEQRNRLLDAEGGLPAWMTKPGFIFACVLFLVMYVVPLFFSLGRNVAGLWSPAPAKVVQTDCVGLDEATSEDRLKPFNDRDLRETRLAKLRSVNTALHTIESCPLHSCSGDELKSYRHNIGRYLGTYQHMLEQMNREHGEAGLRWTSRLYFEDADRRIAADLKARIDARQVRYSDLQHRGAMARWLVERPNQPVRLCRKQAAAR